MAITLINTELSEESTLESFKVQIVNFKGDVSYTTGGTAGIAAKLGFAHPVAIIPLSHGGYTWDYDPGTDKMKMYTTAGTEVANAVNLSAITYRALVLGES